MTLGVWLSAGCRVVTGEVRDFRAQGWERSFPRTRNHGVGTGAVLVGVAGSQECRDEAWGWLMVATVVGLRVAESDDMRFRVGRF